MTRVEVYPKCAAEYLLKLSGAMGQREGGAGGGRRKEDQKFPLPVPCTPGSHPFCLGCHFKLFLLHHAMLKNYFFYFQHLPWKSCFQLPLLIPKDFPPLLGLSTSCSATFWQLLVFRATFFVSSNFLHFEQFLVFYQL